MKETSVTEAFCEILGGLGLFFLIVPILDLTNTYSMDTQFQTVLNKLDLAVLGSILLLAYLAGAMVDALGLAIEELFLAKLIVKNGLTDAEKTAFWKGVSEHVLKYRDLQWAWYSCYRNLFILLVPSAILWTWAVARKFTWCRGLIVFSVFIALEISLVVTMKVLTRLYFEISRSI